LGKPWTKESGTKAAHPNSRFCTPAGNCKVIDPLWEDPKGVPISAILFGGRRPEGVPLIYEAFNWQHGVFVASALCSETTAAAEHKGKAIMRDPFAMRPFFGYNAGHYFRHWLSLEDNKKHQLPKIFHVNWFRKNEQGKFIWPGKSSFVYILRSVVLQYSFAIYCNPSGQNLRKSSLYECIFDITTKALLQTVFWQFCPLEQ